MSLDLIHVLGEVAEMQIGIATRMGGEQRGWDGYGLVPHHRQRWHNDRQGAPSQAG